MLLVCTLCGRQALPSVKISTNPSPALFSPTCRCTGVLALIFYDETNRQCVALSMTCCYRQLASAAAAKLSPLQQWHQQHIQRQQEAAVQAHQWWGPKHRVTTAVAAATGRAKRKHGNESHVDGAAGADSNAAPPPAAAAADATGNYSREWSEGPCDYNPNCPVCIQELQHQQQQQGQTCPKHPNSSKGPYSSWPVPYDDPFIWRRLIWRLLGKVSPGAQAFYAQYLNMCPHCCDEA